MKVRTEARREAIVEAARHLFQELGYERASMNELAKRLGGSKATLYGYFASKEELFSAVVRAAATAHLSDAIQRLQSPRAGQSDLRSMLLHFGECMLRVVSNDAIAIAVYRMVVAEAGRSDVGQLFYQAGPSESVAAVAAVLEAAMARGELRQSDPTIAALHFLALLTAEVDVRIYQRDPPPLPPSTVRKMVERAVEMFLFGAAPRQAASAASTTAGKPAARKRARA
ncbi:TetR/AcrR family transcriptional regulator [Xanthomonas sp. NCPPB 2654]|uniref:TetR/AcrR family transcriptional regulator n=1 Tax=unclassified Xanthomonas TaxID=2643310 RepID=UPI0021E03DBE|nr:MULTISPECIES: TetR/AcrR family transcriptional regulator [unclassified Xanthomonas]MDL5364941.1 TetR/AcrR family transcriptional regulator [Xanthomonas sp. NCPPB 2654]UYC19412.1 TetR/AcrR family transcriptional regulator [Xanthomonas sp. CFBP 8443]